MPLQVFKGNHAAALVYAQGVSQNPYRRYDAGMGGFAVAQNFAATTALGTSGALPCQIIVVHKAAGHGALGHYAAHNDPGMIVQGVVVDMVQQLGGPPKANIVLAAGLIGNQREQLNYEIAIVARLRGMYPGVSVVWPAAPVDDVWGSCYYLPLQEQVGLLIDSPGGFVGSGDAANGITVHPY